MGVDAAWARIESWLKTHAHPVRESLRPPAKLGTVRQLESSLGVTLPADFITSLAVHNGQSEDAESGLIPQPDQTLGPEPAWRLMSVTEIITAWTQLKELLDGGEFAGQVPEPAPGVRTEWWFPGWVPFADDGGGDHLCLDTTPGEEGRVGQVVGFRHDARSRPLLAGSFEELLTRVAEGVVSGRYVFDTVEGLVEATCGGSGAQGSEQPSTDRFLR